MKNVTYYLLLAGVTILGLQTGCTPSAPEATTWHFTAVPLPAAANGGESRFFQTAGGMTWLSWVSYLDDSTDVLQYAPWQADGWGPASTISQGHDWFVNWADFPALSSFQEEPDHLVTHWLQKSAAGTYDYDIKISLTDPTGQQWLAPQTLHRDTFPAEHGFLSFVSQPGHVQAVWLDGRQAKTDGPMSLRTAKISPAGQVYDTLALDRRVCDCCQTAAVATRKGLLVAYRDRSETEIRDISLVRETATGWSAPYQVHPDGWKIAGCPVNGPSLASFGDTVALAWFTGAVDSGAVYLSFSTDGGTHFGPRLQLNERATLGRIATAFTPAGNLVVVWLESQGTAAVLRLQEITPAGKTYPIVDVAPMSVARASGFPQVVALADALLVSYTDVDEDGNSGVVTLWGVR